MLQFHLFVIRWQ